MLSHYLSIAYRHLTKNVMYSLITIFGLAIGVSSVFLILQFVKTELSYDRFHKGAENIYRIAWHDETPQTRTPHPVAEAMVRGFPDVESAVSVAPIGGPGVIRQNVSVRK